MLLDKLSEIQKNLKAPKDQYNSFGKYAYRSCEDILKAVKPYLDGCILTLTDEIVNLGDRFYIKATATIADEKKSVSVSAYAREDLNKKGMDQAQLTGSCSSYARKYALNGLFLLDDSKEIDSMDNTPEKPKSRPQSMNTTKANPTQDNDKDIAVNEMRGCKKSNPELFNEIAAEMGIKGKTSDQITIEQCKSFINKFTDKHFGIPND